MLLRVKKSNDNLEATGRKQDSQQVIFDLLKPDRLERLYCRKNFAIQTEKLFAAIEIFVISNNAGRNTGAELITETFMVTNLFENDQTLSFLTPVFRQLNVLFAEKQTIY